MKVYHGSKIKVEKPLVNGSKSNNDYGAAFYLTLDLESAHEWACRNNSVGLVNVYDLSLGGLNVLDLTDRTKFSILNWVAILLHFRSLDSAFKNAFNKRLNFLEEHYFIDVNEYDVVIGYRADDAYFRFPVDFVRGNLTIDQLERSYMLGNLGIQYALKSEKAISHLIYKESIMSNSKYIQKYFDNVANATKQFDSLNKDEDGLRIIDIMRAEE